MPSTPTSVARVIIASTSAAPLPYLGTGLAHEMTVKQTSQTPTPAGSLVAFELALWGIVWFALSFVGVSG